MPTLQQTRTAIDDWLAARWPTVTSRQADYFASHGRYWQGLRTRTVPVQWDAQTDGSAVPDALDRAPADSPSWRSVFPEFDAVLPAVVRCDVYDGPLGIGYVVTVEVTWNGRVFWRSQNVGPEVWRTVGWTEQVA